MVCRDCGTESECGTSGECGIEAVCCVGDKENFFSKCGVFENGVAETRSVSRAPSSVTPWPQDSARNACHDHDQP